MRYIDITGNKYGRLTVLHRTDDAITKSGYKKIMYTCQCECGKQKNIASAALKSGATKSCGCLNQDSNRKLRNDLTGRRFNSIVVLYRTENKHSSIYYHCRCDCGNELDISYSNLVNGKRYSCGCEKGKRISDKNRKNLIGKKFGQLTVIEDINKIGNGRYYKCECDCGNIIVVSSNSLTTHNTRSCGCFRNDHTKQWSFKDLTGKRFGELTVIELYDKTKNGIRWKCRCDCGNEVIIHTTSLNSKKHHACSECQGKRMRLDITGQQFGDLTVIKQADSVLISGRKETTWLCVCKCGNEVIKTTNALCFGHVVSCGCNSKPHGEILTEQYLKEKGFRFETQKSFDELRVKYGNLSYDFYIEDRKILIEYQGRQHYMPVKKFGGEQSFELQKDRDKRKKIFAASYGYTLIEIPYTIKSKKAIYQYLDDALGTNGNYKQLEKTS